LGEGENSFSVTARDAIGNESASVTVVVVLDTTAPEIPSVTSALFVNYDNYMLVGTKESNSSIRINGVEQIPIDDATTWQFNTTLSEGNNVYSITSQDVFGHESSPASITVVLDTSVPTKPTVTSALETNQTSYTLTGTKATNTSIWVDGQERINSNSATDWSWVTSLSEGENIFSIVSKNRFDTASLANLVTVTLDTTPPGPITNFTATPDEVIMDSGLRSENGALDLTWTNPTDSDFSGVRILRSSEGFAQGPEETASQKIEINFESGTSARDTDYRLLSGLPYYYTAYTYDNLGNFTTTPTLLQATPGMPGDLDHSFNAPRGYVRSEYMNFVGSQYITTTSNDSARAVAVQKDGKVVVVGNARNSYMDVYRFTRDGALDLTFNLAGKVDRLSSVWGPGYGIALQEDGKIVVVGSYFHESRGYEDMTVWRFTSDGKIDTSFNRFGYVTHDTGIKLEQDNMGSDVVVQPDGKIVVAGYGLDIVTNEKFMTIWRFTTSGALDTTFNGKGWATHNVSEISTATSLILQSDGKIVVAGSSNLPAENARMTLWRFTQNGQLDSTFNSSGIITYSNTPGSNDMSYANDLALQADGKIVVVGNSRIANNNVEMTIWRYTSAGVLDTDFNATGKASHSTGIVSFAGIDRTANADMGSSVLIQQDGKIVVAGEIRYESATLYDYQTADMALWRYLDTGVLDKTFNATGAVIMNHGTLFAPDFTFTTSFDQEYATDVALQTNGYKTNIIVVGASAGIGQYFMSLYYSNLQDLTVWRYLQ
jgi:uncharacterized delta-60 repeat protein